MQANFWCKYNMGAANLELMNEILRNVDWESTLDGLDINDSWATLNQFIRMLLTSVFLNINQN